MKHHWYEGKTSAKILIILRKRRKINEKTAEEKNFHKMNTLRGRKKLCIQIQVFK